MYSNDTDAKPPAPDRLRRVWGVGKSSVAESSGTGAYFLDRIAPGEWAVEVFPDVVRIADPYTGDAGRKTELREREVDLAVNLPDLGGLRCVRLMPGRHVIRRSDPVRVWKTRRRDEDTWRPARRMPPHDGSMKMSDWNLLDMAEAMSGRSKKNWMMDFEKSVVTDESGQKCFRMAVKKFGDKGRFVRLDFDVDGQSLRRAWAGSAEPSAAILRVRAAHPATTMFRLRLGDDLGVAREANVPLTGEWRDVTIPLSSFRVPSWSRKPPPDAKAFRLERIVSFTLEFGRDMFPKTYGEAHGIEIASIRLTPDTSTCERTMK